MRSLLERGQIPSRALAARTHREALQPEAIHQTHKWFGRRRASTVRAILAAWSTTSEHTFWTRFEGDMTLEGTLLDPFCGAGTMLIEGARAGMRARGVDAEPVAAAVSALSAALAGTADVADTLATLARDVGARLRPYHQVRDAASGHTLEVVHHLWVEMLACARCAQDFPLHPGTEIGRARDGAPTRVCPQCSRIETRSDGTCPCGAARTGAEGNVRAGTTQCPHCGHRERLARARERTGCAPRFTLFAHEVHNPSMHPRARIDERWFIPADDASHARYAAAERALEGREHPMFDTPLAAAPARDARLRVHRRLRYRDLFNARQRLHLSALAEAIDALEGDARQIATLAASDTLRSTNMLCGTSPAWRRLRPLFAVRGWHHVTRPVEVNPWLDGIARGTFPNAMRRIARAMRDHARPRHGRASPHHKMAQIEVRCADSASLSHIADQSIDIVVTDPPYWDKIDYTALAGAFRPWLAALGACASRRPPRALGARDHAGHLARCLTEAARTLRTGAVLALTYQGEAPAWAALAAGLRRAGLEPRALGAVLGDSAAGHHKRGRNGRWDALVVTRKPERWTPLTRVVLTVDARDERRARQRAAQRRAECEGGQWTWNPADRANIARAALAMEALERRGRHRARRLADALEDIEETTP